MMLASLTLAIAFVLFILSTRQWRLTLRLGVWFVGAAFLGLSTLLATGDANYQSALLALVPEEGRSSQAIAQGWKTFFRLVPAQWDWFLFLGLVVGLVGLLALSPGEVNEKAVQPVMIGTIGAVVGGMLMLFVIAVTGAV